jgi:hypothetical protein
MKKIVMSVLAALMTWNAMAQVAPVLQLHCCKCFDGPASSLNISTGQASPTDQLWTVNGVAATTSASPNSNWLTSIPTGWIEPAVSSGVAFRYKTSFIVPNCTIPMAVSLTGKFAADNNGVVTLDGTTPIASCTGNNCFSSSGGAPFSFNVPSIAPGFHTLQVDVTNLSGVTGMSVQATLRAVCRECEPCPIIGSYDGANCQIGQAPAGTSAFIYNNNFYYTPAPGNSCPLPGSWFDSANCYVMPVPPGTTPFIWQSTWWYVQPACHPVAKPNAPAPRFHPSTDRYESLQLRYESLLWVSRVE